MDRLFGPGSGLVNPRKITCLSLNLDAFALANHAELVILAIPVALRRIISDLIADAVIAPRLLHCCADILSCVVPASRHIRERIKRAQALRADSRVFCRTRHSPRSRTSAGRAAVLTAGVRGACSRGRLADAIRRS